MKKKFFAIFTALVMVIAMSAFTACDNTEEPNSPSEGSLTLSAQTLGLEEGDTATLRATATNTEDTIGWTTSDSSVATVSASTGASVTVTAVSAGTATITASVDSLSATCEVTVTEDTTASLSISPSSLSIDQGETATLTATVKNIDSNVTWSTSSNLITVLSSNTGTSITVTGGNAGSATITASAGSLNATCTVTVNSVGTEDNPSDINWNITDNGDGTLQYKFEAECADLQANNEYVTAGLESTIEANNYPSGDAFVYKLGLTESGQSGSVLTFNIYSSAATTATLSCAMGLGDKAISFNSLWKSITLNGTKLEISNDVKFDIYSGVKWYDWTNVELCDVELQAGNNAFVFTYGSTTGLNFDYITLDVDNSITLEVNEEREAGDHSYSWEVITDPTSETEGTARAYCDYCRHYKTVTISEIGGEGWLVDVVTESGADYFGVSNYYYYIDSELICSYEDYRVYPTNETTRYNFECENTQVITIDSSYASTTAKLKEDTSASGGYSMQYTDKRAWKIDMTIVSDRDCSAIFIIYFGGRATLGFQFNSGHTVTVNGEEVSVSDDVYFAATGGTDYQMWADWEICIVNLKAGTNVISVIQSSTSTRFANMDYWSLITTATLTAVEEEV